MMTLTLETKPVPLAADANGVLRVGETRVPLDRVVYAFNEGASAEEIVMRYSTLDLADVYAVIAHYLNHKTEVDRYLEERREQAAHIQEEVERRFPQDGTRTRLLARRGDREPSAA
jgi:uncharacterized protein (DUF433 family)